jgi:hypothetical protein
LADGGGGPGEIFCQGVGGAFTFPMWDPYPPPVAFSRSYPGFWDKNSFPPGQGEKYLSKVVSGRWAEYAWER